MSETAVRLEQVSKYYKLYDSPRDRLKEALNPLGKKRHREFYALKNIDLEVKKGEILGIVGRNGSGKSTLLQLIAKVIPANSGRITTIGKISTLLDLGAGLNPDLDGIQNIYFGGLMQGIPREEMKNKLEEIVAFAAIGEFIRQPLKTYSSGMRARLGFALAVYIDPDILVVDEVLAVGDEFFRRKCYGRIEKMLESGCTVLMVSHDVSAVNQFCTRALLLDCGELIFDGVAKTVTAHYQRLLFAGTGSQISVREDITNLKKINGPQQVSTSLLLPASPIQADIFLPAFVSANAVVSNSPYAKISDIKLETPDGRQVNVLCMDANYRLTYTVDFLENIQNVFFTMAVNNEKGWNVSSCETRSDDRLFHAREKQIIRVEWGFTCRLLARDYFINVGMYHLDADRNAVLIGRVTDALLFRVQPAEKTGFKGLVHLNQTCRVYELP